MTDFANDTMVVAAPDVVSCDLAGDTAILHLTSGVYFTLNPIATTIWMLIQESTSVRDIHASLLMRYQIDAEACAADLLSFLRDMSSHDLIAVRA